MCPIGKSQKFMVFWELEQERCIGPTFSMAFALYFEWLLAMFTSFWIFFHNTYHVAGILLGARDIEIKISESLSSSGTQSRILKY